jgi:hypothetical protein
MGLREIGWGGGVDLPGSGKGLLVGSCECGDEPSGSGATELVGSLFKKPKERNHPEDLDVHGRTIKYKP